ncbi:MAG TPA: hypothetical protein VFW34_10115 [Candidatus Rubrimentiphilum sp.]|nr:hypothetical protein [Candidatus Rubrimentiphilum sp.]
MSSRADRRRQQRGGSGPPPRRDPMIPVYIGLAVFIVLVFVGFGIMSAVQNSKRNAQQSFVTATPTPGAGAKSKPIQLKDGAPVGKKVFPTPDPAHGFIGDTIVGGRSLPVDNIPCETSEAAVLHVHSHLAILNHGVQVQVPPYLGMASTSPTQGCLYWIHTHDPSGIIHIEAGSIVSPNGGNYTLGNFFDIWGEPLSRNQVGPFKGLVTAFVNGSQYSGDIASIPLRAHQQIVLEVGTPVVPPPNYIFPFGD